MPGTMAQSKSRGGGGVGAANESAAGNSQTAGLPGNQSAAEVTRNSVQEDMSETDRFK